MSFVANHVMALETWTCIILVLSELNMDVDIDHVVASTALAPSKARWIGEEAPQRRRPRASEEDACL